MNVTRWPTAIVMSSGDMPAAVIVIVGGPTGAEEVGLVGAGVVATGEVGAVGDDEADPPEQAAFDRTMSNKTMRSTAFFSPAAQPDGQL